MKQRGELPFDIRFFSKQLNSKDKVSIEERFKYIYNTNHWSGDSSVSGQGSDDSQTKEIRKRLPLLVSDYKIKSILDIPCGDFNWMKDVELNVNLYIGADIVEEIIKNNSLKYSNEKIQFEKLDLTKDILPEVDLVFCRDCLVHLSNVDITKSIANIKRSKSKYILTTTFIECDSNEDILTGDWRVLNLSKKPFNFPEPVLLINENCNECNNTYSDKCLGLWRITDL